MIGELLVHNTPANVQTRVAFVLYTAATETKHIINIIVYYIIMPLCRYAVMPLIHGVNFKNNFFLVINVKINFD